MKVMAELGVNTQLFPPVIRDNLSSNFLFEWG